MCLICISDASTFIFGSCVSSRHLLDHKTLVLLLKVLQSVVAVSMSAILPADVRLKQDLVLHVQTCACYVICGSKLSIKSVAAY